MDFPHLHVPSRRRNASSSAEPTPNVPEVPTVANDKSDKAQVRSEHVSDFRTLVRSHDGQVAALEAEKRRLRHHRSDITATERKWLNQWETLEEALQGTRERLREEKIASEEELNMVRDAQADRLQEEAELNAELEELERDIAELRRTSENLAQENQDLEDQHEEYLETCSELNERLQAYAVCLVPDS
jgi:chromosome segregation ATPase